MEFSDLFGGMIAVWLISVLITILIFYFIIKVAVKNAILEVLAQKSVFVKQEETVIPGCKATIKEMRKYMKSRYDYYDKRDGCNTKDKYTSQIWKETAEEFGVSQEQVSEIL